MSADIPAVVVRGFAKTFRTQWLRRRVTAVRDVSFEVSRGEIFGLLGPNGAGKTTTIKMLLGLVAPDRGSAEILGVPVPRKESRAKLGFLPENPYFYDHLSPRELLDDYGRLFGLPAAERRKRTGELLERLGIAALGGRPIRKLSKGQVQRVGMAQALISDPELLILDEPMSGLDPIGRKEFRDILLERAREGATVMFSSHILPDVEMIAERVAIIHEGVVADQGAMGELLQREATGVDVGATGLPVELAGKLAALAASHERRGEADHFVAPSEAAAAELVREIVTAGGHLVEVVPRRGTLEDLLLRLAKRRDEPEA
ncbi:MAG: ABC transporter ATP-binding protein [Deltaproteobacteria bacterium]|nr:ABC transporter ATP-binding protein [Deltaproteobacteria bacterium]